MASLIYLLLLLASRVYASQILLGVMPQGKSHAGSFMPLLEELMRQGHNVTLYMDNYGMNTLGATVNEWFINVTDHRDPFADLEFMHAMWKERYPFGAHVKPFLYGSQSCTNILSDHRREFDHLAHQKWDLVMTDSLFAVCAYGIAEVSNAHHVVMHSTDVESGYGTSKGYARNYLTMPRYFLDFDRAETNIQDFIDRMMAAYEWLGSWITFVVISNNHMRTALSPVLPNFDIVNYYADSSMSFTDMPLHLYVPMATNNELFIYGAYCRPHQALRGELAEFVNDPKSKGTILIAFGTIVDWSWAPKRTLDRFIDALNELEEYRIVWVFAGEDIQVKKHVRIVKWMPQNDILQHNTTKLLITHGGLKSLKEATCAAVPALVMPMFAEQVRNSWLVRHHKLGAMVNKVNFTSSSLVASVRELINSPKHKQNVVRMRKYYDDAPMPAVKEAAFKVNRLLKYYGRMPEYFYTRSINMSFITYLNLDLIIISPLLLIVLLSFR